MSHLSNILAEGFEDWVEIVVILGFLVLSLLFRLIKKASENKQARQQKQRWEQISREREVAKQQPAQSAQQQVRLQAPPRQAPPAEQIAQALKRAMGIPEAARQPPVLKATKPKPSPPKPKRAKAKLSSVESAAARTHRRLPGTRQRSVEEDPYAMVAARGGIDLRLLDPEQARRAIILHEVLSAPKALRKGGEMWDA